MAHLLLLNGPNLNLLGSREPDTYGNAQLSDIEQSLSQQCAVNGHTMQCFQSNAEHQLIDAIHQAKNDQVAFIIFNPAAFTHTSVALRDALLAVDIPFIEVHLSNIYQRESFRHHSYFSDIAHGIVAGLGVKGYELALNACLNELNEVS